MRLRECWLKILSQSLDRDLGWLPFQKGDHLNSGFPGGETRGEGLNEQGTFSLRFSMRLVIKNHSLLTVVS